MIKSWWVIHDHRCESLSMIFGRVTRGSASKDKRNVRPVLIQSPSLDQVVERITEETGHEVTKITLKTVKT